MTVNTATGEIATVDTSSEVAVTSYLQHARDWLATAIESTGPEQIAIAKAEIATAAEATKQLRLSKDIREDAVEMVRRAEYTVVRSIRKGQKEGTVAYGQGTRQDLLGVDNTKLPTATEIEPNFYQNGSQLASLGDVEAHEFEEAITEAKAEGNLSRSNVVRKAKGFVGAEFTTRSQRADIIRDLADKGWSSRQMPNRVGVAEETVRQIARDYGIPIPGDKAMAGTRRHNSNDIVDNLVIGLEGSAMSLDLIVPTDLDRELAQYWATSLTESLQKLNRFAKQIKEIAQ